jgi:hypothetical protein
MNQPRESITRASYWRRKDLPGMLPQYPSRITHLEVGRFGELILTVEMGGEVMGVRFSVVDTARIRQMIEGPK